MIQLPRTDMFVSSSNAYPDSLPEQLGSSDTRNSLDPFPPTIRKITLTILTTKSPDTSPIFIEAVEPPKYPPNSHHLTPETS